MPKLHKSKCLFCGEEYVGSGANFCSKEHEKLGKKLQSLDKLEAVNGLAKKLTTHFRLYGDYIVSSDWHLPLMDKPIVEKLFLVAQKFNIKKLAIVGDFINFDTISRFDHKDKEASLIKDLKSGEMMLEMLFDWFERIDWCYGNHDDRLARLFDFQLNPSEMGKLISDEINKKLFISAHPYMELENGGKWRLTHPKNYSRITARVPFRLVSKYRCSVLGAHGHHQGFCFDESGNDIAGDLGTLSDLEKTHYLMYSDTDHPVWNKGFGMVRNGCYYQFSSNPKATDWDFWLSGMEIKKPSSFKRKAAKKKSSKKKSKSKR